MSEPRSSGIFDFAERPVSLEAVDIGFEISGRRILQGATFKVAPGECVALVGESGAGKTTLLRCFNRLVVPTTGHVAIGGAGIAQAPVSELRRRIGYVPQHGGLLPHWSVLRNCALVPTLLGQENTSAAAERALDLVGLPASAFGHRFPHQLSGGQRQRVALARAIAARPGLLLMDEPFGALDAISRSELQATFAALRRELKMTTVLVTHDLLEADLLANETIVMRGGVIEQRGTLRALRASPQTDYVASLLARGLPPESQLGL